MDTDIKFSQIYGLLDKRSGDIVYIGKSNNPQTRFKQHIHESKKGNTKLHQWIRANPDSLELTTIACAIDDDWQTLEQNVIAQYRQTNSLLNIAKGGNQPSRDSSDPFKNRVWILKKAVARILKEWEKLPSSEKIEEKKAMLRYAAWKRPELFGEYKSL